MSYDDWRDETRTRLKRSGLYTALKLRCEIDEAGPQVLAIVDEATFYAFQKTKTILKNMGEFTLHDGDHLFRVLTLMERILGQEQIAALSVPELLLLILSAFFHDIGMAADEKDVQSWRKFWDLDPIFTDVADQEQYEKFKRHCSSRPDQVAQIESLLRQGNSSQAHLYKDYLIADHIRLTHADRAKDVIKNDWMGKIKYRDTDLTVEFALICFSHNEDAVGLLDWDRKYLCGPDVFACLPLVGAILRLADLLDFDAKRTPQVLLSHLFVKHPVSIREWNKHRAVEAWSISNNAIQFHAKCGHPAIQASIHAFCNVIDQELSACNNIVSSLNDSFRADGRDLLIRIPFRVDRSRIETRKNIDGKPEFSYRETQFNLSKGQVIDLLMGTKLYGNPEVALRELLQNSIDACLLRSAMERSWGNQYKPDIQVKYRKENGEDVLEVIDNGIGMDQNIIDKYYSRVGASFYKSAEFYDLKSQSQADFVPASRFGIGILSCFMVADTLVVDTRKVYEPHSSSEPLNVTIEGQESIFWIRPGKRMTPGTSTKLILRENKNPWQRMDEDQFIKSVENVIPNPPFAISIESGTHVRKLDENSFRQVRATSLADYSWNKNQNIRELELEFIDPAKGFVGTAFVAIMESHGAPASEVNMTSKSVTIDDESYELKKQLKLDGNDISLSTTTISIDEKGAITSSSMASMVFQSRSKISLHGIEVPMTLFPRSWEIQNNQAKVEWPIPMLLVIDVCGRMDLDLNSSRTQIIISEKWIGFEEALYVAICAQIANKVGPDYWAKLKEVLVRNSKSDTLLREIGLVG
jgi:molecular chaperone HtpG